MLLPPRVASHKLPLMRDIDTLLSAAGLFNDTAAGIASLSHVGLDAAKLLTNLAE